MKGAPWFALLCIVLLPSCLSDYDPAFDYLPALSVSPAYLDGSVAELPAFVYPDPADPGLVELRTLYGLDAVAGSGSDLERVLAVLRWVHETVPHDGSSGMLKPRDALTVLAYARDGGGVNCRLLAITLNEALVSLGYRSRFLGLLPARASSECHVVNAVFVDSLGKWIYVDPTYGAYFPDADGLPLSPLELRAALQRGERPALNADANYNGGPFDVDYWHYLTKNFYYLECMTSAEPGYDSSGSRRVSVILEPANDPLPYRILFRYRVERTSDSAAFFAPPSN